MTEDSAPQSTNSLFSSSSFYCFVSFIIGAFTASFLTYQIAKKSLTLQECFLVHEAVGEKPQVLGGSTSVPEDISAIPSATPSSSSLPVVAVSKEKSLDSTPSTSSCVNLNTATLAQLDSLSGIGPAYAQKIIDGRPYSSIGEVVKVKGIGTKTYEKIKDRLCVE